MQEPARCISSRWCKRCKRRAQNCLLHVFVGVLRVPHLVARVFEPARRTFVKNCLEGLKLILPSVGCDHLENAAHNASARLGSNTLHLLFAPTRRVNIREDSRLQDYSPIAHLSSLHSIRTHLPLSMYSPCAHTGMHAEKGGGGG